MEDKGKAFSPLLKILIMVILLALYVGGGVSGYQLVAIEQSAFYVATADTDDEEEDLEKEEIFAEEVISPHLEEAFLVAWEEPSVDVSQEEPIEEEKEEPKEENKPLIAAHKVQSGETLWDIARAYGTDINSIVMSNNLANANRLRIGQELTVPTLIGVIHKVDRGETLSDIASMYRIQWTAIMEANGIENPNSLRIGQSLLIPGAREHAHRYQLVRNGVLQQAFSWPLRGRISSRFGPRWGGMHNGVDVAVVSGTPIRAAADGRVVFSGWNGGYGNLVRIDHGNGIETRYAHNSRNLVRVGERVQRGQVVARSGNTGNSTGPHLHFEIRYRGTPVDPLKYLIR